MLFRKIFFLPVILLLIPPFLCAKNLYKIEERLGNYDKTYFIYADKKAHTLYLMDKDMKVWKRYSVATGEKKGNKLYAGDFRTPEGIYEITEIYQYHEPWYITRMKKRLESMDKTSHEYKTLRKHFKALLKEYKANIKKIRNLNSIFLSAKDGHFKFGTKKSLGTNSYGPVFMRLSFPGEEDLARYKKAKKEGKLPKNRWGIYKKPGSGIAIHGTNDNPSLGHNASAGCIRMNNEDIMELSNYVMKGTMVVID